MTLRRGKLRRIHFLYDIKTLSPLPEVQRPPAMSRLRSPALRPGVTDTADRSASHPDRAVHLPRHFLHRPDSS